MEQINMFALLTDETPISSEEPVIYDKFRSVGEKVGRVVLGECRIATVTEVCGNEKHIFYRTGNHGCYSYAEGLRDIEDLIIEAEIAMYDYKTFVPSNLTERFTVEYIRECDNRTLWAQIGILGNYLFWKEDCTYQFLVPYNNQKQLKKEYEKHKKMLMRYLTYSNSHICDTEHPMERLYWSKHGFFATAEYVEWNG